MSDDTDDLNPNPIVAMAMRIRARRDLAAAVDASAHAAPPPGGSDAAASLTAFADALKIGTQRLESILGRNAITFVRLERPLRVRLRFRDKRVSLDLDAGQQLVIVRGLGFDGEYQFIPDAPVPALINLSKLSTDEGYGDALTPSILLKTITQDAQLPRPAHLDPPE